MYPYFWPLISVSSRALTFSRAGFDGIGLPNTCIVKNAIEFPNKLDPKALIGLS